MFDDSKLFGGENKIVDETFFVKTKYNVCLQTILETNTEQGSNKRKCGALKGYVVQSRSAATLQSNIAASCLPNSTINTDSWSGYRSLISRNFDHNAVNHKTNFVAYDDKNNLVTTNCVESAHSYLKRKSRSMKLLIGHPSQSHQLIAKIQELLWRFNNRNYSDDLFLLFSISVACVL